VLYEKKCAAHCVPTRHDPRVMHVQQMVMHTLNLSGCPYEFSNLRIPVPGAFEPASQAIDRLVERQ
jgi:hypothetical protein